MNDIKELIKAVHDLENRIVALETQSKERHNTHKERLELICRKIEGLSQKQEKILQDAKDYTNWIVGLAVGFPTVIAGLIGLYRMLTS